MRWTAAGAETFLRRVVATLLGLALLMFEGFIHDGDPRWPILWAGLALTFGPSVLGLIPGRPEVPTAPEPPALPPTPTGPTGGPS